jgi:SAM-dependent methyltransferase
MTETETELKKVRAFYDDVYYASSDKPLQGSRHLAALAAQLGLAEGNLVLDIACGRGEWLHECAARGARISGVDISEEAIKYCRHHLPDGEFVCQAAEVLPFKDQVFDLVTCLGSLEHFVDPVGALKEMRRVAKQEARLVILVPNSGFLTRRLSLYGGTDQTAIRENVKSLDEWQSLLNQAGLKIQRRWRDLHVLSWNWIAMRGLRHAPIRAAQALALSVWPLRWQYQVYHLCVAR